MSERIGKSILKYSISSIVNAIIGVVAVFFITRYLPPEINGKISLFNSATLVILSIVYLGLDQAYIRFFNEPPKGNTRISLCLKLIIISMVFLVSSGIIVCIFFTDIFSLLFFSFTSRLLCVLLFANVFSLLVLRFFNITYRMTFNIRNYNIQNILTQAILRLTVVIVVFFSTDIRVILSTTVAGLTLLAISYFFVQKKDIVPKDIDFNYKGYSDVFRFAIFLLPLPLVTDLNIFLAQKLIVYNLDYINVGIYSSANYFVSMLSAVKGGFANYWSAYMFAYYKENKSKIQKVHNYLLIFSIGFILLTVIFKDLIYLLIGEEYHGSKSFFPLVLLYPILALISETTYYGISIAKKNYITLINFTFSVIVNLIGCIILIPKFGLNGAAFASAFSGLVLFIMNTYFGQKYYKSVKNFNKAIFTIIILFVISVGACLLNYSMVYYIMLVPIIAISCIIFSKEIKYLFFEISSFVKKTFIKGVRNVKR